MIRLLRPAAIFSLTLLATAPASSWAEDASAPVAYTEKRAGEASRAFVAAHPNTHYAGFELVEQSNLLAHPEDDHTKMVFTPGLRGLTDQTIFKFRKPAR